MTRSFRTITLPIVFASIAVALSVALLVGWTLIIVQNTALTEEVAQNIWLLVLGLVSFVFIMAVLVIFSVFLAREIQEVRRQNSFIDSVTHELKSPLASIKLCLETLHREGLRPEQREELRRMMLDDVSRLSSFIDDILQASRLSHQRASRNLSDFTLRPLIEECMRVVSDRQKIPEDAIRVHVDPDLMLYSDRAALEVVIRNLIDNAVKYSPEPPDVTVSAKMERDRPIIEVTDKGIGIPRIHLKRVFQRFYRVPQATVHERRGTGLGLFVVAALVRSLGGRVSATSNGSGEGTTIRIELGKEFPRDETSNLKPPRSSQS